MYIEVANKNNLNCVSRGVTNNINDGWWMMSQRAQHQDPDTEAAKWNSATICFII